MKSLINKDTNKTIIVNLKIANSFSTRFKGLMFKLSIDEKEGLLLKTTKQIHTFWMLFPIDVIYLQKIDNSNYLILAIEKNKKPWKIGKYYSKASDILEIKGGLAEVLKIEVGNILTEESKN